MDSDMWATLPYDLLVDIFRRLGSTAVIRCAGVCRPWRRAIIDNASCLRPRPDRFLPGLLVAFLDTYWRRRLRQGRLEYVSSGAFQIVVVAMEGVDVAMEGVDKLRLMASRDGFLLFCADSAVNKNLYLCNPDAGSCRLISATALSASSGQHITYILATGGDYNGAGGPEVRILALGRHENIKDRMTYQVFSSTSGVWGPVKCSAKINEHRVRPYKLLYDAKHVVVCNGGSVVYFFAVDLACLFAMDMSTEQTWTADLPEKIERTYCSPWALVLATSEDDWLSLIVLGANRRRIEVWVLDDDSLWTLQRTMDLQSILPNYASLEFVWLTGFCPRSGVLFGYGWDVDLDHHFLVGMDGSSPRLRETVDPKYCYNTKLPYEMSWSTYISKMKYF